MTIGKDFRDEDDILDYQPELKYEQRIIETINNTMDFDLEVSRSLLRNGGSSAIKFIDSALMKAEEISTEIETRLRDVCVPIKSIDETVTVLVSDHPDGDRLINNGDITYPLYKYSKENPALYQIAYAWEMHHAGIDGMVEAELLSQVDTLRKELDLAKSLVEKTVNYNLKAKNLKELEEKELEELRSLSGASKKIDDLYKDASATMKDIHKARSEYSRINALLRLKGALSKTAISFGKDASDILDVMAERLKSGDLERNESKESARKIKSALSGVDGKMQKLIVYEAFKSAREGVVNKSQDSKNIESKFSESYKDMITSIRVCEDVAIPVLAELEYVETDDEPGFGYVLQGAESIIAKKQAAVSEFKNTTKAASQLVMNQTKSILDKDKMRGLYKSF